jgi:hypothetical protein
MDNKISASDLPKFSAEPASQERVAGSNRQFWWQRVAPFIPLFIKRPFLAFDKRVDGAASFFVKHWGKSRFMISMSKRAQYLGLENLFLKGPKAFIYFFLFYLVRDTVLYILIPIFFAKVTSSY